MSDYLIDEKTLTSFADSARGIYNKTGILTGQQIVDDVKGIVGQVEEQRDLIDSISRKFFDKDLVDYCSGELVHLYNNKITKVGDFAFRTYSNLVSVNLPNVTSIGDTAFINDTSLTSVNLPKVTSIGVQAFEYCPSLSIMDLPSVIKIKYRAFNRCNSLTTLIIRTNEVCVLDDNYCFNDTPIESGLGYIYVPKALIEDYKIAENWSRYKSQFRPIEDYPEICEVSA